MKLHFISIGGSAMHNLAIALHKKGYEITGSDDEIFEPSRSRLASLGLLPEQDGWFPEKIHPGLDAVVLGMHARLDNPELIKAQELGVKIFSYPEFLYEQSKDKQRIVVGGSHGKTTITSMILHALQENGIGTDFMVGAQIQGFDVMVKISSEATTMVLEGDEYLTSAIDPRPKFHLYRPHIAVLSGIAWDHMNAFKTFESYVDQFRQFINLIEPGGYLFHAAGDEHLDELVSQKRPDLHYISYEAYPYEIRNATTYLKTEGTDIPVRIFGKHNMANLNVARLVCERLGLDEMSFIRSMSTFEGAAKRLQRIGGNDRLDVFLDFAHSPSKLRATLAAVKERFGNRQVVACIELHTYSSLNKDFLPQYRGTMDEADEAIVYFNPHALELKRLNKLSHQDIREAFGRNDMQIFDDSAALYAGLLSKPWSNEVLLLMSSGNFNGMNFAGLAEAISK